VERSLSEGWHIGRRVSAGVLDAVYVCWSGRGWQEKLFHAKPGHGSHRDSDDWVDAHRGTFQRMTLSDDIIGTARKAAGGPCEKLLGHMTKVPSRPASW